MVLDTIRVYFTYTSMDWIGLDFGSARIVSSYELGEKIYLNHLSQDDNLFPVIYVESNMIGDEVIPFSILDPKNVLSHFQLLLGMQYNETETQKMKQYIPATLINDGNDAYAYEIQRGNKKLPLPVASGIEWLFREVVNLIVRADKIDVDNIQGIAISVPLAFKNVQKCAVREAALAAGFMNVRILNDTHAALLSQQHKIKPDEKRAICICCDQYYCGASFFNLEAEGEWKAVQHKYLDTIRFLDVIQRLAQTLTDQLWRQIEHDWPNSGGKDQISPAVFFKVSRLTSRGTKFSCSNDVAIRYNGRGYAVQLEWNNLQIALKEFANRLASEVTLFSSQQTSVDKCAIICIGDCFNYSEVVEAITNAFPTKNIITGNTASLASGALFSRTHSQINDEEDLAVEHHEVHMKNKTLYPIGFILSNIDKSKSDHHFTTLLQGGVELPITSENAITKKFYFPEDDQYCMQFYEKINDNDTESYRPFKEYIIRRDADHPMSSMDSIFCIQCTMDEEGMFTPKMTWKDNGAPVEAYDVSESEANLKRRYDAASLLIDIRNN